MLIGFSVYAGCQDCGLRGQPIKHQVKIFCLIIGYVPGRVTKIFIVQGIVRAKLCHGES